MNTVFLNTCFPHITGILTLIYQYILLLLLLYIEKFTTSNNGVHRQFDRGAFETKKPSKFPQSVAVATLYNCQHCEDRLYNCQYFE